MSKRRYSSCKPRETMSSKLTFSQDTLQVVGTSRIDNQTYQNKGTTVISLELITFSKATLNYNDVRLSKHCSTLQTHFGCVAKTAKTIMRIKD